MNGWIDINIYTAAEWPPTALKAVVSSRFERSSKLLYCKVTNRRNGGCSEGLIRLTRTLSSGHVIACGDLLEIKLTTIINGTKTNDDETIYIGMILDTNEKWDTDEMELRTVGLFKMVENAPTAWFASSANINSIVGSLFTYHVLPNNWCKNTTSGITIASPIIVGDCEFSFTMADEAIKKLAFLQGSVEYGIGIDGILYFRDEVTTLVDQFQAGLNASGIRRSIKSRDLVNAVFVRCNHVISSGSLMRYKYNYNSVTTYRKRERVVTAPELIDHAKLETWITNYLAVRKDPITSYSFRVPSMSTARWPNGMIRLIDSDGTALTTEKIAAVTYTFNNGILDMRYVLGEEDAEYEGGDDITELRRALAYLEHAEISNARIAHTGYEEFKQYVEQDAMQLGKYNIVMTEFEEDAV